MNFRQALIHAALCGWNGDLIGPWPSPANEELILSRGYSFCNTKATAKDLRPDFMALVEEGLFFRVHPDIFESPCYYCSYDVKFIEEILDTNHFDITEAIDFWDYFPEECDEDYTTIWRTMGLCSSQGSQTTIWGTCLGKECCTFKYGNSECIWDLKFLRK
jgi:hypothetical protein